MYIEDRASFTDGRNIPTHRYEGDIRELDGYFLPLEVVFESHTTMLDIVDVLESLGMPSDIHYWREGQHQEAVMSPVFSQPHLPNLPKEAAPMTMLETAEVVPYLTHTEALPTAMSAMARMIRELEAWLPLAAEGDEYIREALRGGRYALQLLERSRPMKHGFVDEDTIVTAWCVEDVRHVAPGISDEDARHVLTATIENFDASYGICWETLAFHADGYPQDGE